MEEHKEKSRCGVSKDANPKTAWKEPK